MEDIFRCHLPQLFENKIVKFTALPRNGFSALVRSSCKTSDEATTWIREYEKLSLTQWNVCRSYPNMKRLSFRKEWECQFSSRSHVRKDGPRNRARNCEARIGFKIKLDTKDTRKKDAFVKKGLFAIIEIHGVHTHSCRAVLSFRTPRDDVRQRFYQLFADGYTAAGADHYHRSQIALEHDGDELVLADASRVPAKRTISYWYQVWREEQFGDHSGPMEGLVGAAQGIIDVQLENIASAGSKVVGVGRKRKEAEISESLSELRREAKSSFLNLLKKFCDDDGDANLANSLKKFTVQCKSIRNANQLASFLHSAGNCV